MNRPPASLPLPSPAGLFICFAVLTLMGCLENAEVIEPEAVTPAAADTVRNLYAFKSPAVVKTVADLRADGSAPAFTYFSFATGAPVADSNAAWDLAFRSTTIKAKGEAQLVPDAEFDKLASAPDSGYGAAFPAWYDYSGEPNHTITPKAGTVIVVRTAAGKYAKIEISSYYKGRPAMPDGLKDTARYYSFRYLLQDDGSRNLAGAADPAPPAYFSLMTGKTVEDSAQPWDLAFRATNVRVSGAAQLLDAADFDLLKEAPETGYTAAALPAWYVYSGEPDHTIAPKPAKVFAIRTADGKYAKLQVLSYYKDAPASPLGSRDEARYYTFRYVYQADGTRALK
jgi:hypothetical protein